MWYRYTNLSKCCWKISANRFAQCRVATKLQFVKNAICAKCNKTNYACISFTSLLITSYQIAIPQLMFFGYIVSIYLTNNFSIYLLFINISYYLTPSILKTWNSEQERERCLLILVIMLLFLVFISYPSFHSMLFSFRH